MEKEDVIYKRCKVCWCIYPADVFKKGKDERGHLRIPIKKCLYCGTFRKFELVKLTFRKLK